MKLSFCTSLATFAIIAIVATPVVAQSFDRLAQSDSATQIMSTSAQDTVTILVGLEV